MDRIYVFIIRNDIWIYIICSFGLFWYVTEWIRSQRLLRRAMFNLEKETGRSIRSHAARFSLFFIAIISIVYFVNVQIAPTLPAEILKPPTSTPDIFATRLSSPTPLGSPSPPQPSPTIPLVPTVTLPGQGGTTFNNTNSEAASDTEAATPTTPDAASAAELAPTSTPTIGCYTRLNITSPRDGSVVSGVINFIGTADTEDFLFYKLEINGPETEGQWASLLGRTVDQPVNDGALGSANLQEWSNGPYLIRLTAVDSTSNESDICVIQVTLN